MNMLVYRDKSLHIVLTQTEISCSLNVYHVGMAPV